MSGDHLRQVSGPKVKEEVISGSPISNGVRTDQDGSQLVFDESLRKSIDHPFDQTPGFRNSFLRTGRETRCVGDRRSQLKGPQSPEGSDSETVDLEGSSSRDRGKCTKEGDETR